MCARACHLTFWQTEKLDHFESDSEHSTCPSPSNFNSPVLHCCHRCHTKVWKVTQTIPLLSTAHKEVKHVGHENKTAFIRFDHTPSDPHLKAYFLVCTEQSFLNFLVFLWEIKYCLGRNTLETTSIATIILALPVVPCAYDLATNCYVFIESRPHTLHAVIGWGLHTTAQMLMPRNVPSTAK